MIRTALQYQQTKGNLFIQMFGIYAGNFVQSTDYKDLLKDMIY